MTPTGAEPEAPSPEDLAAWIASELEAWGHRVVEPASVQVAPGSDLDGDGSLDLPGGRHPAQVVWRALATAGEHAAAAGYMSSSADGGVFAKPFLTLARTTLIGAAKALYLLEPDDPDERRVRALRLLRTESKDVHRLVGVWRDAGLPDQGLASAADELRQDSEAALIAMQQKPNSEMGEAALLEAVAHHLDGGPADPLARIRELWNMASGNAHARAWAWDTGLEDAAGVEQFVRIWILPVDLMHHAWNLWGKRRSTSGHSH